ncbi:MAG TPA: hypothetical protein VJC17_00170 [Candidatus Dojkabacteria bacterium]|nr:hypothetical protein [Candidatus Dojkabacteria bacterium]
MAIYNEVDRIYQVNDQRTIESLFASAIEQRTPADYLRWVFSNLTPDTEFLPSELLRTPFEYLTVPGQDESFTTRELLIKYLLHTRFGIRDYERTTHKSEVDNLIANTPDAFEFADDGLFSLARRPTRFFYFPITGNFREMDKEKFTAQLKLLPSNKIVADELQQFLAEAGSDFLRIKALCNAVVPENWDQINTLEQGSDPKATKINKYEGTLARGCKAKDILAILANVRNPASIFQFMGKLLHIMNEQDAYFTGWENINDFYEASRHNAAKFAMYIFAPMADIMNLPELYRALIDSSLAVLDPVEYAKGKALRDEALAIQIASLARIIYLPPEITDSLDKANYLAAFFDDYFTARASDKALRTRIKSVFSYMRKRGIAESGITRNFEDIFAMRLETQLDRNPKKNELPSLPSEISAIIFDLKILMQLHADPEFQQELGQNINALMAYLKLLLEFFFAKNMAYTGETFPLDFSDLDDLIQKLKEFHKKHPNAALEDFIKNIDNKSEEQLFIERTNLSQEIADALLPLTKGKSILLTIESAADLEVIFDYYQSAQEWLSLAIEQQHATRDSAANYVKITPGSHLQTESPYWAIHLAIQGVETSVVTAIPTAINNAHHFSYKHRDQFHVAPTARLALLTAQMVRNSLRRNTQMLAWEIERQEEEYGMTKQAYSGISTN